MEKYIGPNIYGLSNKVILTEINKNHIAIVKKRKSRIIMNDGQIILNQINKIRKKRPDLSHRTSVWLNQ